MAKIKRTLDKGIAYLKRNGLRKTCIRTVRKCVLAKNVDYEAWLKKHYPDKGQLNFQRSQNMGDKPIVSIRILTKDEEKREQTQLSVLEQTYGFLAVTEKHADSEFVCVIRDGAILASHAIYEFVHAAMENTDADLFYCDDDVWMNQKLQDPFCKPEYDACLFMQWNYLGDVLFLRKSLADRIVNMKDYEEIVEKASLIKRIPQILVHTNGNYRRKRKLQERFLTEEPKVSVIIPNKDHTEDLKECIDSIVTLGGYRNLEILVIENNSTEPDTERIYDALQESYSFLKVLRWEEEFNYSLINNYAAVCACGEYLLFLNNDTKVKKAGSLMQLMKWGTLKECGAIGARLLFADETIQHAGVVLGYGNIAGHAFEGMTQEQYEEQDYAHLVRRMTAVTAACMLVKKEAFLEAGCFDPELKVAYNDIDLCMKLQKKGWLVLYNPYAEWYHYESQTRGLEMSAEKADRVKKEANCFCKRWEKELEEGDFFYNPNLTLEKPDFSLIR